MRKKCRDFIEKTKQPNDKRIVRKFIHETN